MGNFILNVMNSYGYIGVFFLIAIENLFPPIPSEVILTFGGFLTTYSDLTLWGVVISSTFGSLVGAIILYKLGSFIKVDPNNLGKTNEWFVKHGIKAVFLGRFVPIIRSLISIPAGVNKVNMKVFIIYTTLGSLIWNFALVYAGSILGENWPVVTKILGKYSKLVLGIIIAFVIVKGWKKLAKKIQKNPNLTN